MCKCCRLDAAVRKSLERLWGVELQDHKAKIDDLVMERVSELRREVEEGGKKRKRGGCTPVTEEKSEGKKKSRVGPTRTSASKTSQREKEEARLLSLIKRCKLSRPRNINKVMSPFLHFLPPAPPNFHPPSCLFLDRLYPSIHSSNQRSFAPALPGLPLLTNLLLPSQKMND